MSGLQQVRALYEYNEWANDHVLETASGLSDEEFGRDLGASYGSVQGNLWHTVSAQVLWLSRFRDAPPTPMPELEPARALDMIRRTYQTSHEGLRDFIGPLSEGDLSRALSYVDTRGNARQRLLWQSMLHVVNHGTHHRAETALLLTSLGYAPRQLDYVFFEIERGQPGT